MACTTHLFLPFVNYSCMTFPHAPRDNPFVRIISNNLIDSNLSSNLIDQVLSIQDPFYVDIKASPEPIPDYVFVQDPASQPFRDKLVGIAIDGVPIYSGLTHEGYDAFYPPSNSGSYVYTIDGCGGSYGPTPSGWRYHYRIFPACLDNNATSSAYRKVIVSEIHELLHSFEDFSTPKILGYSLTGYPIYSPLDAQGQLHDNLDNCNGKFDGNNNYGYYTTLSFPYTIGCDGPGVYSTFEQQVSLEGLPTQVNIRYDECPGGTYPSVSFQSNGCVPCPPGKYSITKGKSERVACSAICPIGSYCPAGSVKPLSCPGGQFGSVPGLGSPVCSGSCQPGYYCPPGSIKSNPYPCGNITFYCPASSSRRLFISNSYYSLPEDDASVQYRWDQAPCDPGTYCIEGKRYSCPAGRYGNQSELTTSDCSAACPVGFYCPIRTVNPIPCPAGTFGNSSGITNSLCSGLCAPGHYCPAGSTSDKQIKCAAGLYGAEFGLSTKECSPFCEVGGAPNATISAGTKFCESRSCAAGYVCPPASTSATQQPCGGPQFYCPPHSVIPTSVLSGYYSIGRMSEPKNQVSDDALVRTSQVKCEPGYWCSSGIRQPCDRGSFGSEYGLSSSACNGPCAPGFLCDFASPSSKQYSCGLNASVYCPQGSFTSIIAPAGFYTVGNSETTRLAVLPCPPGMYCVNGMRYNCAAGRYSVGGSATSDCDGFCEAGYYCPPMSTSSRQLPCPAGRYGTVGMTNAACAGGCTEGYYCPASSSSPLQVQCGGENWFCPRESGSPIPVDLFHYSTGGDAATRTAQVLCVEGHLEGTPPASNQRINICPSTTVMP